MRYHKIEVDDEVFDFLKKRAEAFVDTPNTVLRRLLFHGKQKNAPQLSFPPAQASNAIPNFPSGVPAALREILAVARLVMTGSSRVSATKEVATQFGIAQQTVLDKYCRQLGLQASDFDRLLEQPMRPKLIELLVRKFPRYEETIRKNFGV